MNMGPFVIHGPSRKEETTCHSCTMHKELRGQIEEERQTEINGSKKPPTFQEWRENLGGGPAARDMHSELQIKWCYSVEAGAPQLLVEVLQVAVGIVSSSLWVMLLGEVMGKLLYEPPALGLPLKVATHSPCVWLLSTIVWRL